MGISDLLSTLNRPKGRVTFRFEDGAAVDGTGNRLDEEFAGRVEAIREDAEPATP